MRSCAGLGTGGFSTWVKQFKTMGKIGFAQFYHSIRHVGKTPLSLANLGHVPTEWGPHGRNYGHLQNSIKATMKMDVHIYKIIV